MCREFHMMTFVHIIHKYMYIVYVLVDGVAVVCWCRGAWQCGEWAAEHGEN